MKTNQSVSHLEVHQRQNNIFAICMSIGWILVIILTGVKMDENRQEGETSCSCSETTAKKFYILGFLMLLITFIVWILNRMYINKKRNEIIDLTIDDVNSNNK